MNACLDEDHMVVVLVKRSENQYLPHKFKSSKYLQIGQKKLLIFATNF